jgi:plasmid maintenance system antidote protein VapI
VSKQSGDELKHVRAAQRKNTSRVWEIIAEAGVKRRWVAKHLGISYGYLNQIQYGHAPMTKPMRIKLAEYLGLPEEKLFEDLDSNMSKEK